MKFTYTNITGYYTMPNGEMEQDGIEFTYEVDRFCLAGEVKQLVTRDFGEKAWEMVETFDLVEEVAEGYYEELKGIFEQEAMEWYND